MARTEYGDISPRTAAYTVPKLLEVGMPYQVLERIGTSQPLPARNSKSMIFGRYEAFDFTPNELTEGVTPAATKMTRTDITLTLKQYGDRVEISDIVQDTHEDPVLQTANKRLGQQASKMIETVRFQAIRGGTNVFYGGSGNTRDTISGTFSRKMQRKAVKALEREYAERITEMVASTPNFNTENVLGGFIGLVHTDLVSDIRNATGFIDVKDYGGQKQLFESEIGAIEDVRWVKSQLITPWADSGKAVSGTATWESTSGASYDVYPAFIFAKDAFALSALRGQYAVTPMVVNPKPSDSDPLGQRGHVGWKSMQGAVILNDSWMARLEVYATV